MEEANRFRLKSYTKRDGKMTFVDARTLIQTAADHGVLQYATTEKTHILVYHAAGEVYPEGWYADSIDDCAYSIMEDEEGRDILLTQLEEMHVQPEWFDWEGFDRTFDIFQKFFE